MKALASAIALWTAGSAGAQDVARLALVVGANHGLGGDTPLRYAETDALRFASVLREIGRHRARSVRVLRAPSADRLVAALSRAAARVRRVQRRRARVVFTFYYSGHANPTELRLSGGVLPLAQLRRLLRAVPAHVRLVVLDACHAGAYQALARKGGQPAPPFRIRLVDELSARGEVVIASSSSHEEAQESEALRGSFFTSHLLSGLRGAADHDRDARVTLSEAYHYAYAQTLRSTAFSHAGLQHPSYQFDVTGKRDLVLTWPGGAPSHLTLRAATPGPFLVFSADGSVLYAEVQGEPGEARRIALRPGRYLVHKRAAKGLLRAELDVAPGEAALDEGAMRVTAYEPSVGRGGGGLSLVAGTRSFAGLGLDLRLSPLVAPAFGGAFADTARTFGFPLGAAAGVEVAATLDRYRWWSLGLGLGYARAEAKRRLETLSLSSLRLALDGRFVPISTPRVRCGVGAGLGLYRSATKLGDFDRSGWVGGVRAGFLCTAYLWNGFGLGLGYTYAFVNALQRDELDRPMEVGGHELTILSLSFRL
jgi:hypothetical protein